MKESLPRARSLLMRPDLQPLPLGNRDETILDPNGTYHRPLLPVVPDDISYPSPKQSGGEGVPWRMTGGPRA